MIALAHRLALPLALAALAEVVFLRLLMRGGAFLPRAEQYLEVYRLLMLVGTIAANLAMLLAGVVITGLAVAGWQRGGRGRAGALALLAAGAMQLTLALFPTTSAVAAVATLVLMGLAFIGGLTGAGLIGSRRVGVLVLLAAYLAALYYAVAQPASALGLVLPGGGEAFLVAEALAVVAVGGAYLLARPPLRRGAVLAGAAVGLLVLAGRALAPWTMGTATIWTVAFSLYLPAAVYAIAAALAVYWLLANSRRGQPMPPVVAGMLLIFAGGLKLDYGYFAVLALAGYLIVISAVTPAATAVPAPTTNAGLVPVDDLGQAPAAGMLSTVALPRRLGRPAAGQKEGHV